MKNRMRMIVQAMVYNQTFCAILGAFGCGVFGWDSNIVARMWREILIGEGYSKFFTTICFAVYDGGANKNNYNNFREVFRRELKKN